MGNLWLTNHTGVCQWKIQLLFPFIVVIIVSWWWLVLLSWPIWANELMFSEASVCLLVRLHEKFSNNFQKPWHIMDYCMGTRHSSGDEIPECDITILLPLLHLTPPMGCIYFPQWWKNQLLTSCLGKISNFHKYLYECFSGDVCSFHHWQKSMQQSRKACSNLQTLETAKTFISHWKETEARNKVLHYRF